MAKCNRLVVNMKDVDENMWNTAVISDCLKNVAIICNSDNMHVKNSDLILLEIECNRLGLMHAEQDCIQKIHEISIDLFNNIQ